MGPKQLFLADITTEHLTLLNKAASWSDVDPNIWIQDIHSGSLQLYSFGDAGLVGIYCSGPILLLEIFVGSGLGRLRHQVLEFLKTFGKPIDIIVQKHAKVYEAMGFVEVAKHMRFSDVRK